MTLTLQAIQDRQGAWIPQVQGRYINMDWNPTNQGFGAQCWDLAAHWSQILGLPVINTGDTGLKRGRWPGWAGNMVDCFPQTPEIAAAYELISSDAAGQLGDIPVWGDSYWYYPATHVAVLVRDSGAQLLCMSQNSTSSRADNPYPQWSSGPATIQYLPRQGLIGFIRPRTTAALNYSGTITPLEALMAKLDDDDRNWMQANLLTKADGGTLRKDLEWQNAQYLNKDDGAYMNNQRDLQYLHLMEAAGKTLNKDDGGYIVGLIEATRPGQADPQAVAEALKGIIPQTIAVEVLAALGKALAPAVQNGEQDNG
ncbi:hypothetical protein [Pseudarthrobacter polychromogenes]|uniref:Peptidase C51 domain-containing protein n=1 Tax=Pseudarthrobacter polychromogenes TaxID=1676 RepID=A0ABQ1X9G5_9MICC|nr:hypothetical protein [Pseudarthrobacter polychromogenes]GGG83522.1 hypothetical protein GCM10011577_01190 [Pseudarthrobacter polychromogenes]